MLFNTLDFAIFVPIVFLLYWFVFNRNIRLQNLFVVVASYFFYGWWDWKFLILITITSLCSWGSGLWITRVRNKIRNETKIRRWSVVITASNIVLNLLILCFFKYYNFFVQNFVDAFSLLGKNIPVHSLKIILPVGISFYTFQALSYTIDVYRKKVEPTKDVAAFFAFISFFPLLVAGPIERATSLLHQFYNRRVFDYEKSVDGLRQILWGLFKKVVIADNCAMAANTIFNSSADLSGSTLAVGALFFAFQIYGDFSGYSDIAIGTARLFGFNAMRNFAFPYFSRDIAEFWRRWHISLTTWFRDYLYIPLGGSRCSAFKKVRNTFIIFLVSGFWHGADWTFIVWGALHAVFFLPLLLTDRNRKNVETVAHGRMFPSIKEFVQMGTTFLLVVFSWIFFRADNIAHAWSIIGQIFSSSLFSVPKFGAMSNALITAVFIVIFMVVEWMGRDSQYAIEKTGLLRNKPVRYLAYYAIVVCILWFSGQEQQFIYFQF